MKMSEVLKGL